MKYSPFEKEEKNIVPTDEISDDIIGLNLIDNPDVFDYYVLKKDYLRSFNTPKNSICYPKDTDYENGGYTRYFIKKRNDEFSQIIELDESQYKTLTETSDGIDNNIYFGVEVDWKLTGPKNDLVNNGLIVVYGVANTNERTISNKNQEMPGLVDKIRNYIEFAKIS